MCVTCSKCQSSSIVSLYTTINTTYRLKFLLITFESNPCRPLLLMWLNFSHYLWRWLHFQDLPNAMNPAEITDKLGLHSLRHRKWYIQATCATSGDGLCEGLDWLSSQLKNTKWTLLSVFLDYSVIETVTHSFLSWSVGHLASAPWIFVLYDCVCVSVFGCMSECLCELSGSNPAVPIAQSTRKYLISPAHPEALAFRKLLPVKDLFETVKSNSSWCFRSVCDIKAFLMSKYRAWEDSLYYSVTCITK